MKSLLLEGTTIQGIRPGDLVLRSSSERPRKVFTSPLTSFSLQVRSQLNEQDPSVLCNVTVPPQSSIWHVMGNATFSQSSFLSVGLVNRINLTELLRNVCLNSSNVDLSLHHSFQDIIMMNKRLVIHYDIIIQDKLVKVNGTSLTIYLNFRITHVFLI